MRAAVFLDRDGTLIDDRGHLSDPEQVFFYPETVPALRLLQRDYLLFIVTHQSGIGKGILHPSDVVGVNQYVVAELARAGIRIEKVYCCPHERADNCACIKPKPYHLREAAAEFGIDLTRSFVIGDHPHDVELARNAGARGIYVLTGHGQKHRAELDPEGGYIICEDIIKAARHIAEGAGCAGQAAELSQAAEVIRRGGVVAMPTETVYGLAANAFDATAVARIFEVKKRPRFDPLIVHVADLEGAREVVSSFPDKARVLAERFWPGPLTLVLPKSARVPDIVSSGLPTVGLRMPDHQLAQALIRACGVPLAAPSANPFGRTSPTTAQHVRDQLGDEVDMVLDGGACRVGIESTIISLCEDEPALLRAGGTTVEEIEELIGPVRRCCNFAGRPVAPGQLPRHYAPRTPLVIRADISVLPERGRVGLLAFTPPKDAVAYAAVEVLAPGGSLREAAANLFAAMHRLDGLGLDLIVAEKIPDCGLGLAINDRLQRAVH